MYLKKTISAAIITSTVMFSGCKKYLEVLPDNRVDANSVSTGKIAELLSTAYPRANYMTFCETMSDNSSDRSTADQGKPVNQDPFYFRPVQDRDQDSPDYYWYACYNAISAANQALEMINKAGNLAAYDPYKGEALVARAYAHFMLVTLFSKAYDSVTASTDMGIPYVTTPEKTVFGQYDRKTVSYAYGMIENDLEKGIALLNDKIYGSLGDAAKYHFTRCAAHAFATRFYLFKKDYLKVIDHADKVFPDKDFKSHLRAINTIYTGFGYNDFNAAYTQAKEPANLLLAETLSWWGRNNSNYRYGLTTWIARETIWNTNVTGGDWKYILYGRGSTLYMGKFREHFVRTTLNANIGIGYNMIPLFETEEVLLNRAEAYTYTGNHKAAIDDLNTFSSTKIEKYNVPDHEITVTKLSSFYKHTSDTANLIAALLDFRRVSSMQEGLRWFDILRYKLPVVHVDIYDKELIRINGDDRRKILQLPQEVILSGIPQNPK